MKKVFILAVVFLLLALFVSFRWVPVGCMGFYQQDNQMVSVNESKAVFFIGPYSHFQTVSLATRKGVFSREVLKRCPLFPLATYDVRVIYYLDREGATQSYEAFGKSGNVDEVVDAMVKYVSEEDLDDFLTHDASESDCDSVELIKSTPIQAEYDLKQNISSSLERYGIKLIDIEVFKKVQLAGGITKAIEDKIAAEKAMEEARKEGLDVKSSKPLTAQSS
jgi:hypothetical protein